MNPKKLAKLPTAKLKNRLDAARKAMIENQGRSRWVLMSELGCALNCPANVNLHRNPEWIINTIEQMAAELERRGDSWSPDVVSRDTAEVS